MKILHFLYKNLRHPIGFILSIVPILIISFIITSLVPINDYRAASGFSFFMVLVYMLNLDYLYFQLDIFAIHIEKKIDYKKS